MIKPVHHCLLTAAFFATTSVSLAGEQNKKLSVSEIEARLAGFNVVLVNASSTTDSQNTADAEEDSGSEVYSGVLVTLQEVSVDTAEADAESAEQIETAADQAEATAEAAAGQASQAVADAAPAAEEKAAEVKEAVKAKEAADVKEVAEAESKPAAENPAFKAVVEAMAPQAPAKPFEKSRFTFYISDKVAFAQIEQNTNRFKLEDGRAHVAVLYSEERDSVLHTGLSLDASLTKSFRLAFGMRAYIALLGEENSDAFAAAFGAEAAYQLPFKALPLEFSASLYHAPDILTFGSGDRALDAQIDVAVPFRSKSAIFAGIRFLQIDVSPEDVEVDNRLHVGFRWDLD